MNLDPQDAEYLLGRPEFRRFMFAAIQSASILGDSSHANGQTGRDLSHYEGRRSLGFEMIAALDAGQPEPLRSAESLATLDQILREAMNPAPNKEKARGRRNDDTARYEQLDD